MRPVRLYRQGFAVIASLALLLSLVLVNGAYAYMPPVLSESDLASIRPTAQLYEEEGMIDAKQGSLFERANVEKDALEKIALCDALRQDSSLPYVFSRWATLQLIRTKIDLSDRAGAFSLAKQWLSDNPNDVEVNIRLRCYLIRSIAGNSQGPIPTPGLDRLAAVRDLMQPVLEGPPSITALRAKIYYAQMCAVCADRIMLDWSRTKEYEALGDGGPRSFAEEEKRLAFAKEHLTILKDAQQVLDGLTADASLAKTEDLTPESLAAEISDLETTIKVATEASVRDVEDRTKTIESYRLGAGDQAGVAALSQSAPPYNAQASIETSPGFDLKKSMDLAGQNLVHALCPDLGDVPYWAIAVDRQYALHLGGVSGVHNIGRVWDALLRLESVTGFKIPPGVEATFLATTKRYFNNADHMCWEPLDWQGLNPQFELHSFREHLLALNALSAYRHDAWATETGHGMIETLLRASRADCTWDLDAFDYYHRTENHYTRFMDPIGSNGRMIEALVYFYRTAHDPLALELAERFASWHLENSTHPDGSLNKAPGLDHTHSYMCTLRGLLLYGQLTKQAKYVDAIAQTYRHTVLGPVIRESGWNSHDFGADGTPESASAADAAQIGMLLAENGYTECWDDVERLVRCRLIPSQITSSPPLTVLPEDAKRIQGDPANMILGAYGGMHVEPHGGKQAVTDVTAAVLHSLVDIYQHIVTRDDRGVCINLHFDYSDPSIDIRTTRGDRAKVTITPHYPENTLIRISAWTPKESIRLSVGNVETQLKMIGNYALIPGQAPPYEIVLEYALPERKTSETIGGVTFQYTWRGDDIVGVSPNTDFFPFYPSAPPEQ